MGCAVVAGCAVTPAPGSSPAPSPPYDAPVEPAPAERGAHRGAHRGVPAPSQAVLERPLGVVLPDGTRIRLDVGITEVDGELRLPPDLWSAAWWEGGALLGDTFGAMVVAGHVDSATQGLGPFAQLVTVGAGDRVEVVSRSQRQVFEVTSTRSFPRASLSAKDDAFSAQGPLRLVLITCGGPYDAAAGGYRDNVVVVASPVGGPVSSPRR